MRGKGIGLSAFVMCTKNFSLGTEGFGSKIGSFSLEYEGERPYISYPQ